MTFGGGEETITQSWPSFPSAPLLVRLTEVCAEAAPESPSQFKSAARGSHLLCCGEGSDEKEICTGSSRGKHNGASAERGWSALIGDEGVNQFSIVNLMGYFTFASLRYLPGAPAVKNKSPSGWQNRCSETESGAMITVDQTVIPRCHSRPRGPQVPLPPRQTDKCGTCWRSRTVRR